jgi:hypothetical protein
VVEGVVELDAVYEVVGVVVGVDAVVVEVAVLVVVGMDAVVDAATEVVVVVELSAVSFNAILAT